MPLNPQQQALLAGSSALLSTGYSRTPKAPLQAFGVAGQAALNAYNQSLDAQFDREIMLNQVMADEVQRKTLMDAMNSLPQGVMDPNQLQALQILAAIDPQKALEVYSDEQSRLRGSDLMDDAMMATGGDTAAAMRLVNAWRQPRGPSHIFPPGDTQDQKREADAYWDQYEAAYEGSQKASTELRRYEEIERLLEGVNTGRITGNDFVQGVLSAAEQLGFDTSSITGVEDGQARSEAAQALTRQIALGFRNPAGGEGMPGHLSNQDRAYLMQMSPGVIQLPEARRLIVEYRRVMAKRANDRFQFMARMQERNIPVDRRMSELARYDREIIENYESGDGFFVNADGSKTAAGEELDRLTGGGTPAPGGNPVPTGDRVVATFNTPQEAQAAIDAGAVQPGDLIVVAGQEAIVD